LTKSSISQMPRLSAYDPGAVGEGGLDPMGSGAVADRIADRLVPGLRARMSQPRFATLSTVGAVACQGLIGAATERSDVTADIAFEWLVVESMVRTPAVARREGVPGNQKAARARAAGRRLSARTYLNGPRVFGFTGVYRPFSRDIGVLGNDDLPGPSAERLMEVWESDQGLRGFMHSIPGTEGGRLRRQIEDICRRSIELGECAAPPTGELITRLADCLAPREAGRNERQALHRLIRGGGHEIRSELAYRMSNDRPPTDFSQRELAQWLMPGMSSRTRFALQAAIDYEAVSTAIDNTFRRFLAHTTQQHGALVDRAEALRTPGLADVASRVGGMARRAIDAVEALGDTSLTHDAMEVLQTFNEKIGPSDFFDRIIERHEAVQAARKKVSWLDRIGNEWTVRPPYRSQAADLDDDVWTHPMRLVTLARFLAETA
jgi:hypothetical protein